MKPIHALSTVLLCLGALSASAAEPSLIVSENSSHLARPDGTEATVERTLVVATGESTV